MPWFRPPQPQGQEGKHWINFMWLVQSAVGGVGDTIIVMIMMMMMMLGGNAAEHHCPVPLLQREAVTQHLSQCHDLVHVHSKIPIT